jgi:hypothetical protein
MRGSQAVTSSESCTPRPVARSGAAAAGASGELAGKPAIAAKYFVAATRNAIDFVARGR